MNDNVTDFGWNSSQGLHSADYINPTVLKVIKSQEVSRVLDLGAGNGYLCSLISNLGVDVVGAEYDQKGVELAKQAHPNIPFHQLDIQNGSEDLLRKEALFDAVVSTEVIEHLYSPHQLPALAHDVLREGGTLIVSTPYHGYLKNLVLAALNKLDQHMDPLWHGGHIKFWSRKTLSRLLTENGFIVEEFYGVGRFPLLWKSMVLVARKI